MRSGERLPGRLKEDRTSLSVPYLPWRRERGRARGVERKDSVLHVYSYTQKHSRSHIYPVSVQGDRGSAGVSVGFCLSVFHSAVSISQDAAEKEEFHFWSIRRVRAAAVYWNISHSVLTLWLKMICLDISRCGYGLSRKIQYQRVWMLMHWVLSLQAYLISSLLFILMTGLLPRSAMLSWTALLQVNPVIKGHYSGEGNWVWIELDTAVDWSRHTSRQKPCVWDATREVNIIKGCLPYQSGLKDSIKPGLGDLLIQ